MGQGRQAAEEVHANLRELLDWQFAEGNDQVVAQALHSLTNATVSDPWAVVDGYDDRSWIEKGLFRNSKQFWRLTRGFPQKTEAGVYRHLTFVVVVLAVATAYRLWDKAQAGAVVEAPDHPIAQVVHKVFDAQTGAVSVVPEPQRKGRTTPLASRMEELHRLPAKPTGPVCGHEQLAGQGPLRWRRQLRREKRDKVIVFVGHQYGIFYASEMPVLSGVPVRELPPHRGSRDDGLRRYHCLTDAHAATCYAVAAQMRLRTIPKLQFWGNGLPGASSIMTPDTPVAESRETPVGSPVLANRTCLRRSLCL